MRLGEEEEEEEEDDEDEEEERLKRPTAECRVGWKSEPL